MLNLNTIEWSKKVGKMFWRGRDSSQERLSLVRMSRENPDLIDAGITRFFFFNDHKDAYGPEVKHVPFRDFFNVKKLLL